MEFSCGGNQTFLILKVSSESTPTHKAHGLKIDFHSL